MKNFQVTVRRGIATLAVAGILSLAGGIAPASAVTTPEDCKNNYQSWGFASHGECISTYIGQRP